MTTCSPSLLTVAHDRRAVGEVWELAERLLDHDANAAMWRSRHVLMVERQIGTKSGTGGSSGAPYLRGRLGLHYYPLLWELRSHSDGARDRWCLSAPYVAALGRGRASDDAGVAVTAPEPPRRADRERATTTMSADTRDDLSTIVGLDEEKDGAARPVRPRPLAAPRVTEAATAAFLRRYYRHVATEDIVRRRDEDVVGAPSPTASSRADRPQGTANVRVTSPDR